MRAVYPLAAQAAIEPLEPQHHPPKTVPLVACRLIREREVPYAARAFSSLEVAAEFLRDLIGNRDREVVMLLCLDTKNRLLCAQEAFTGTLNRSLVSPREVFRVALLAGANSIILGHNHPSGDPTPSHDDLLMVMRSEDAGKVVDVKVLDHVIVGRDSFWSSSFRGVQSF